MARNPDVRVPEIESRISQVPLAGGEALLVPRPYPFRKDCLFNLLLFSVAGFVFKCLVPGEKTRMWEQALGLGSRARWRVLASQCGVEGWLALLFVLDIGSLDYFPGSAVSAYRDPQGGRSRGPFECPRAVQAEGVMRLRAFDLGLLALLLLLLLQPVHAPIPGAQDVDWLTRYGYLPPADPSQAQLQSLSKLRDAIKTMQRFAGLPETGEMDSLTTATMRKPRCSLPDILGAAGLVRRRRRYTLSGSTWKKRTLTWRIQSFSQTSQLDRQTVRTLMSYALAVWAAESDLTFHEVDSQHQEPDILIHFARAYHQDGYPFDGPGGTLAHAFFPGEHPISGDTHFDDEETWTYGTADGEGTDLFAVAVHEFGHALGLGHSSTPNSIMRPFYQGPVGDPAGYRLSQDDREGLQQLYGKVSRTPNEKPTRRPLPSPPRPPVLPSDRPSIPVPDRCEGNFDAIANIRGEIFFFKGPWFWRLQPSGQLVSPHPARLHRFWEGLPTHVRVIQAAYARPRDDRIILFSGPQFWVFKDRQLEGAARSLAEFGLPPGKEVDAVFSWPFNGKTYLIQGQRYWRYDEEAGLLDPGYPHDLSLWEGAPPAPDDVTVSNTGETYFFKGTQFWRFAKGSVKSEPDSPQPMGPKWLDCPAPNSDPNAPKSTPKTRTCDCHCELNQGSGQLSGTLLLALLPSLAGAVFSC
ncbi:matrix metalloproteinase-25 [Sigmodon hispidus]